MNRINKLLLIIFLILIIIFSSACVFPDKLPELQNLKKYSPEKIEYGHTTLKEFKKIFSKINDSDLEVYTGGITIMKLKPCSGDVYSSIRVGFKNNKLDWIEFNLAHNIKISRFVSIYGNSTDINVTDNQDLDYYNYDFFNISSDKISKNAKSITYFNKSPFSSTDENSKKIIIPSMRQKFFEKFKNIEPGTTLERDFTSEYPNIIPYQDDNSETNSIYVLSNELGNAGYYYDKAILKFESGLLTWVNLIPKNLPLAECLKIIKKQYKKENIDSFYELYDYTNFVLIVDKKSKLVKSIGLFTRDVKL
ncbi:MAG: hypothetical protein WCG23_03065 [bacterium]